MRSDSCVSRRSHSIWLALIVGFFWLVAAHTANAQEVDCGQPLEEWTTVAPADVGLDGEMLAGAAERIDQSLPFLRSLVVVRHGCIAYEGYFGGADADTAFNVFSVTKSVTGTLIGIAIEEEFIGSAYDPIGEYLSIDAGDARARITLGNLLKMLSGIDWDESNAADILGMLQGERDEVGTILSLPLAGRPGTLWNYSTADSHLLSAVLTAATGMPTDEYARSRLFEPLGIAESAWQTDAQGIPFGGTQLYLRAQDMARFGQLYLDDGQWDDARIVPQHWIDYLTTPQLADPSVYEMSYAAHWWHALLDDFPPMHAASGYGGQLILVAPEQDMVIVTTANSYVQPPHRYISGAQEAAQRDAILTLVKTVILPAVQ